MTTQTWSTSADENTAVDTLGSQVRAMAALLHEVEEARYVDPSGGFAVG